jgi:hypothetical protein
MDMKRELVTFSEEYKLQEVFKVRREILKRNDMKTDIVIYAGYVV